MKKKEHQNSGTLCKNTINNWIIPFLSVGKRGFKSNFDLATIFLLIGYKVLIMRYEYLDVTWIGMLLLGFISKFLKKV
ncbi:hypothetical protein CBG49_05345 [Capnocytophaga endodontalis]|uniref:Uncharacterized protein n=1 Tax=Capnocytophaga endodontalis TaxID=2708117 RepID=A0A1Z4BMT2_9FLAO|nr:hypothetical protein CBG49_05345 [Capnocytophaga endodontalis]